MPWEAAVVDNISHEILLTLDASGNILVPLLFVRFIRTLPGRIFSTPSTLPLTLPKTVQLEPF